MAQERRRAQLSPAEVCVNRSDCLCLCGPIHTRCTNDKQSVAYTAPSDETEDRIAQEYL